MNNPFILLWCSCFCSHAKYSGRRCNDDFFTSQLGLILVLWISSNDSLNLCTSQIIRSLIFWSIVAFQLFTLKRTNWRTFFGWPFEACKLPVLHPPTDCPTRHYYPVIKNRTLFSIFEQIRGICKSSQLSPFSIVLIRPKRSYRLAESNIL